jgi:hypothetical protein
MEPPFLAARLWTAIDLGRGKSRIKIVPPVSYRYVGKHASIDEEGDMAIRETLQRILTDYRQAKTHGAKRRSAKTILKS